MRVVVGMRRNREVAEEMDDVAAKSGLRASRRPRQTRRVTMTDIARELGVTRMELYDAVAYERDAALKSMLERLAATETVSAAE